MPEFKLIETLLYKCEQNDIKAEFIIGNETLRASQKIVAEIFEQHQPIFLCISQI